MLKPLQVPKMPLAEPPPRDSRFGSPLKLSRVHWVKPELVVEVTYLPGPKTICCVRCRIRGSVRTNQHGKWCGRCRIREMTSKASSRYTVRLKAMEMRSAVP